MSLWLKPVPANIFQDSIEIRRLKADSWRGHTIVAQVWWDVSMMRKSGGQLSNFRMLPGVIPADFLAVSIHFVAIRANAFRREINQLPDVQTNFAVAFYRPSNLARVAPMGTSASEEFVTKGCRSASV
jgi:hypothetical protein